MPASLIESDPAKLVEMTKLQQMAVDHKVDFQHSSPDAKREDGIGDPTMSTPKESLRMDITHSSDPKKMANWAVENVDNATREFIEFAKAKA